MMTIKTIDYLHIVDYYYYYKVVLNSISKRNYRHLKTERLLYIQSGPKKAVPQF